MKKIILGLMILCSSIFADKITVFAASDLKFALDEIKERYTSVNKDVDINLIYGSSGKGMNQIENGAPFENNSLMTEAYIKYAMEGFALTAGRQAVDLEWLGDYHEAVVAAITAIPDTTVVLGYTQRKAESGIDLSEDFHEFNGNKGAYVIDVKYAGLEGIEFNPYAYSAPDVADWYGLKTTFTADMFGAVAHYAISSEDTQDDGSIPDFRKSTTNTHNKL